MIVLYDGIKMDLLKVSAILKWPNLTNIKQVRAFLGLGNFYQWFIKDYAIIACPLTDLMCKDTPFTFGEKERGAFNVLKVAFMKVPVLQSLIKIMSSGWKPMPPSLLLVVCFLWKEMTATSDQLHTCHIWWLLLNVIILFTTKRC